MDAVTGTALTIGKQAEKYLDKCDSKTYSRLQKVKT